MGELEEFLTSMMSRQIEAEEIIHNGEAAPRMELWTRNDPVTLFGAMGMCDSGWDERATLSVDGGPPSSTALRVTHVYRREEGTWKIVHRHGDYLPVDQQPSAQA